MTGFSISFSLRFLETVEGTREREIVHGSRGQSD